MNDFGINISAFTNLSLRDIRFLDVLEILIITFVIFAVLRWARSTRVWSTFMGFFALVFFLILARIFRMEAILWIADKVISIGAIALVVLFQPELRKALEQVGQSRFNFLARLFDVLRDTKTPDLTEKTIEELVTASVEMGKARTGALIVIERQQDLEEYVKTGIAVDGRITSQLLLNIFEHNTPLHDGAVIIRGDRITAATCYLPLSDSMSISKALGTRHRAGLGISERTDSLTIIVSEETGYISVAQGGRLNRHINADGLRAMLRKNFMEQPEEKEHHKLSLPTLRRTDREKGGVQ